MTTMLTDQLIRTTKPFGSPDQFPTPTYRVNLEPEDAARVMYEIRQLYLSDPDWHMTIYPESSELYPTKLVIRYAEPCSNIITIEWIKGKSDCAT